MRLALHKAKQQSSHILLPFTEKKLLHQASSCCHAHQHSETHRSLHKQSENPGPTTQTSGDGSIAHLPRTMHAAVLTKPGKQFQMDIEELLMPIPKHDEVLIKTRACGVCHSDLHVMQGSFPFPIPAGEIVSIGASIPRLSEFDLRPGVKVVSPFILPCGSCHFCSTGREDLCEKFAKFNRGKGALYDGTTRLYRLDKTPIAQYSQGGLSQYVVVPATSAFPIPENVPYAEAAIVGCSVFTAYGAVRHGADLRAGERVAVIGTGGVGASVIQIARVFGAQQIIAIDLNEDKLKHMRQLGATDVINASHVSDVPAAVRALTGGYGVDVIFEALGNQQTFQQATASVCDGGRAVMIGLMAPNIFGSVEINRLVRRGIRVIGSYGGRARTDIPRLLSLINNKKVSLNAGISKRFSLRDASKAFHELDEGKITGRAIIDMDK